MHNLRQAFRGLSRSPISSTVIVLTLALGIGATVVTFSVVDSMILNPFPFPEPERLVGIGPEYPRLNRDLGFFEVLSPAEFRDIEAQIESLERVVAWDIGNRQIAGEETQENVLTAFWWGDALKTLDVAPALGRGFSIEELEQDEKVAVVSYRLWQRLFGGDPAVEGSTLHINGQPYTLIGVMPQRTLIYGTDVWIPMGVSSTVFPRDRRQFQVLSRLAPGATLEQANAELETLAQRTEEAYGSEFEEYLGWRLEGRTWTDINVRFLRPAALVLMGSVVFVLALVCANITSLLVARSVRRRQEMALRASLGANRPRLVRQLLAESLALGLVGGAVGVGLAFLGVQGVVAAISRSQVPLAGDIALSWRVLVVSLVVSVLAGLLIGIVPALHTSRAGLLDVLKTTGAGSTTSAARQRLQRLFVGVEVALALVLLVGGGLLIHSFLRLQAVDPGLDTNGVLTLRLTLPWEEYGGDRISAFFQELTERVGSVAGVESVGVGSQFPAVTFLRGRFSVQGRPALDETTLPSVFLTQVDDAYFETLGIPLLRGRLPDERDTADGPGVLVANQALTKRYFAGENPIGKRLRLGAGDSDEPWMEIVGEVASAHNLGLDQDPQPELFRSVRQARGSFNQLFLLVRSTVEPRSLLPALRAQVRAIDADQPFYAVRTLEEAFNNDVAPRRVATLSLTLFAAFALILAAAGIYAVVSYAASDRTREIGIRVALGAGRGQVRRLVVRQALQPLVLGGAAGLAAAIALGRLMSGLLFQVGGSDPLTLFAVTLVLAAVALVASYLPARRASRLDPLEALRHE